MRSIFEKKLDLKDGSVEILSLGDEQYDCSIHINKTYFDGQVLTKYFDFSLCRDFEFRAYTTGRDEIAKKDLSFTIDHNDPIYNPLDKLLEYDNPFIIPDEKENNPYKSLKIYKISNKINVVFSNEKNVERFYNGRHKWKIYVDTKSISGKLSDNQKYRLMLFFNDIKSICMGEESNKVLKYVPKDDRNIGVM